MPPGITFQCCHLCVAVRELNLQALTQCREKSAAACKVPPSGADLATPLSPQSYAKPDFLGAPIRHDGKHPDAIIKDFRALHDNTQDETHHMAIYHGTRKFIKDKHHKATYISHGQLHAKVRCIYHRIMVQGEGIDRERIFQMYWCTWSQNWRRGDRCNDCVWVHQRPGRVLWLADWASPVAIATTIRTQSPKPGLIFRWVQVSPSADHNTWYLS